MDQRTITICVGYNQLHPNLERLTLNDLGLTQVHIALVI